MHYDTCRSQPIAVTTLTGTVTRRKRLAFSIRFAIFISLFALSAMGCGGVKLVPVQGTVFKDGKPMADANVSFVPDQSNKESTAGTGVTGEDGAFQIRFEDRAGLSPGKYKVMVVSNSVEGIAVNPDFEADPMMARQAALAKKPSEAAKATPFRADFEAEIESEGNKTLKFEAKSAPASGTTKAKS